MHFFKRSPYTIFIQRVGFIFGFFYVLLYFTSLYFNFTSLHMCSWKSDMPNPPFFHLFKCKIYDITVSSSVIKEHNLIIEIAQSKQMHSLIFLFFLYCKGIDFLTINPLRINFKPQIKPIYFKMQRLNVKCNAMLCNTWQPICI